MRGPGRHDVRAGIVGYALLEQKLFSGIERQGRHGDPQHDTRERHF
jgi:hypothetical protein